MAAKKEIRSDNTYIISADDTDNPKLGAKILSEGRESLFLDYYLGYRMVYDEAKDREVARKERKREALKLYLWQAPRTPIERQQNKEVIELAKRIRFERSQQLLENMEGYRLKQHRDMNFIDYFTAYIDKYNKKDKSIMRLALKRFIGFFNDTPEYNKFAQGIKPTQITKDMVDRKSVV